MTIKRYSWFKSLPTRLSKNHIFRQGARGMACHCARYLLWTRRRPIFKSRTFIPWHCC